MLEVSWFTFFGRQISDFWIIQVAELANLDKGSQQIFWFDLVEMINSAILYMV